MIAVIDSGVANLASVIAALQRLNAETVLTTDPKILARADKVILPGVGAAAPAMAQLRAKNLIDAIRGLTQPLLGICLGMQLLYEKSDESGGVDGLGLIPGSVGRLMASRDCPVPHMGLNTLRLSSPSHFLLRGIHDGDYVYFVHSYAAPVSATTIATAEYGAPFTAMTAYRNFYGCQFHPERSSAVGNKILANFLGIDS